LISLRRLDIGAAVEYDLERACLGFQQRNWSPRTQHVSFDANHLGRFAIFKPRRQRTIQKLRPGLLVGFCLFGDCLRIMSAGFLPLLTSSLSTWWP